MRKRHTIYVEGVIIMPCEHLISEFTANFSAWVWQIARNRYSAWAKENHKRNQFVSASARTCVHKKRLS